MASTSTHSDLGMNRTGIGTSPRLSKEMVEGMTQFPTPSAGDEGAIALARGEFARESGPIGSVPPPLTGKGMLKTAETALKGESPTQFIDKLGERLAFERTGTRLYEALLSKFDALGGFDGGPSRAALEEILEDEYRHFNLLDQALTTLGADPTVMTPGADVQATLGKGILDVMVDARTTFPQCLEAALVAELADNDSWFALVALAKKAGQDELAATFDDALKDEKEHLTKVRNWIATAQGR